LELLHYSIINGKLNGQAKNEFRSRFAAGEELISIWQQEENVAVPDKRMPWLCPFTRHYDDVEIVGIIDGWSQRDIPFYIPDTWSLLKTAVDSGRVQIATLKVSDLKLLHDLGAYLIIDRASLIVWSDMIREYFGSALVMTQDAQGNITGGFAPDYQIRPMLASMDMGKTIVVRLPTLHEMRNLVQKEKFLESDVERVGNVSEKLMRQFEIAAVHWTDAFLKETVDGESRWGQFKNIQVRMDTPHEKIPSPKFLSKLETVEIDADEPFALI
jgi:hypothetical protein